MNAPVCYLCGGRIDADEQGPFYWVPDGDGEPSIQDSQGVPAGSVCCDGGTVIRKDRGMDTDRIQAVPPTPAESLAADLRSLQDLANRRGGTWLIKWAVQFQGVKPGAFTVNLDTDPAYATYLKEWPLGPDPRD